MTRTPHSRPSKRTAATVLLTSLLAPPLSASDIRSHPEARGENRPHIHQAGNGTPVVNITTPGSDGVSHNVYEQLDVDDAGVVFNNGRQTSATALAGQIGANPALAGGTAALILNEVRAASPSQLAGYLEIGGDPADLVVANPAGITCNGCGFINAERAMLTTGKPRFADGRWAGLDVRGGRIRVEGNGMDASRTAEAELLARVIEINTNIWAEEINATSGVGQFDPDGRLVGSMSADSPPPEWSIDTAHLGGMYANKIRLVANEHGVGVRNAGTVSAGPGGLTVTADGRLLNEGQLGATGADIRTETIDNRPGGNITATRLELAAEDHLNNHGLIDGDQVGVLASDVVNHPGARLYGNDLSVTAATLRNLGHDTQAATLATRDRMRLAIDELDNRNDALILSAGDMGITGRESAPASRLLNRGATIEAVGALAIEAERIENRNDGLITTQVDEAPVQESWIQLRGSQRTFDTADCSNLYHENVWCRGYPHEISDFTWFRATAVTSHTEVVESQPATIRAGGDMTLVGDTLVNADSQVIAGGELKADLGHLNNRATQGQDITRRNGTARFTTVESCGLFGSDHCREWHGTSAYNPAPVHSAPYDLPTVTFTGQAGPSTFPALPSASLFRLTADNPNAPLVETDPRFADYRHWYGSQAMLDALARDPAYTQKRLGDGFYEQSIVRQQVVEQTGQRRLDGFADDEAQFRALIDAGIAHGRDLSISPGVRLSAEQLAHLTTDIVWLEESTVSVDGETQRVLVPTLHLADDTGMGSSHGLIAAREIELAVADSATNRGRLQARDGLALDADRIKTLGGLLRGEHVTLATGDLRQRGGEIVADSALSVVAGRDIIIEADTRHDERVNGANRFTRDQIIDAGRLAVAGPKGELVIAAGRDLTLQAAEVAYDGNGAARLSAGRDLRLTTATEGETERIVWDADNRLAQGQSRERGARIDTQGDLVLTAGEDIAMRAGQIDSRSGHVSMTAGNDIRLESGRLVRQWEEAHRIEDDGWVSGSVSSSFDSRTVERHVDSSVGADRVTLAADKDVTVQGSRVISDRGTRVEAGSDVQLLAGRDQQTRLHFHEKSRSGLFSNGGLSATLGRQRVSRTDERMQQTASPAQLASIDGDVTVRAGETYHQTGSDALAPGGGIDIRAGRVEINEARETARTGQQHEMEQSGVTLALTSPVIDAAQGIQQIARAAGDTDSDRMKRLAAASAGLAGMDAYSHIKTGRVVENANLADKAGGVSVNVSVGTSENRYLAESRADTARGSRITAGGDIRIDAGGRNGQSDIVVRGSDIRAQGSASLRADDGIRLLAAESRRDEKSENDSRSASLGIGVNLGTEGAGFSLIASAGRGEGETKAGKRIHHLTHVTAGKTARLQSGNDTALVGAVVSGQQVESDIGDDLHIASVQDQSRYRANQEDQSIGASMPIGGWDVSGSYSKEESEAQGKYRSVTEPSAIRAGMGGFDLDVAGNTDLVGSVIASTAVPQRNRLITGTLTTSDLTNTASAYAKASGVSLSSDMVTRGKYGAAKALVANAALDAERSASSRGDTRSAIDPGTVTIISEGEQEARTGLTAGQTIAFLHRDTSNAHDAAKRQDPRGMRQAVEADRAIKKAVHAQAVKFTDESYRTMFLREHPMFLVIKDEEGKPLKDPETGKPVMRKLSEEEKRNLKAGPDGKVAVFTNGIFNDEEAAAGYSAQMSEVPADQPIYLIHFPEADNAVSELLVAGYQKFMENDFWGLANATKETRNAMAQFGNDGLYVSGHSRGAMTIGNAATSLARDNTMEDKLTDTRFRLVGPAYNANRLATQVDNMNGDAPTRVELQNHADDFVGSLIGGNEATYDKRPEDSSRQNEWLRMFDKAPTVHSCYGNGAADPKGCFDNYGKPKTIQVRPTQ